MLTFGIYVCKFRISNAANVTLFKKNVYFYLFIIHIIYFDRLAEDVYSFMATDPTSDFLKIEVRFFIWSCFVFFRLDF